MDERYESWIAAYEQRTPLLRGRCAEATTEMVAAFPELRRVAGLAEYYFGHLRKDQHWWCVAPNGDVVDPTAGQFPCSVEYVEIDVQDPAQRALIPTGVCANCGDPAYHHATVCSDACGDEFAAYLNSRR